MTNYAETCLTCTKADKIGPDGQCRTCQEIAERMRIFQQTSWFMWANTFELAKDSTK